MARKKHWGAVFCAAACALVMLAFFSALVVRPEAEAAAPPPELPVRAALLLPYTLPAPDAQPQAPRLDMSQRSIPLAPPQASACFSTDNILRDANGHVIARLRYLDCVYQAFRQETACG